MKIKLTVEGIITIKDSDSEKAETKLEELVSLIKTDELVEDADLWVEYYDKYDNSGNLIPIVFDPLPPDIEASLLNATYTAPFTSIKVISERE